MSPNGQSERQNEIEYIQKLVNYGIYLGKNKLGYIIGESTEIVETKEGLKKTMNYLNMVLIG